MEFSHTNLTSTRKALPVIVSHRFKPDSAVFDDRALRLPRSLALFPDADLNRDLYLWLAALAAVGSGRSGDWFAVNQWSTRQLLAAWPGLAARYHRLLAAHLGQRPDPAKLPPDAAAGEQVIRRALRHPGSEAACPLAVEPPFPDDPTLWPTIRQERINTLLGPAMARANVDA